MIRDFFDFEKATPEQGVPAAERGPSDSSREAKPIGPGTTTPDLHAVGEAAERGTGAEAFRTVGLGDHGPATLTGPAPAERQGPTGKAASAPRAPSLPSPCSPTALASLPGVVGAPLRFSHLRLLGQRSPAHLAGGYEPEETGAMERGSAVHALALGAHRVVAYGGKVRRGSDWESFRADNQDALILTATEYERAAAMAAAIHRVPLAVRALEGEREKTLLWRCADIECRSTPDVYSPGFVTDLKTSRTSKPDWFESIAIRSAYHAALMWYGEALRTLKLADPLHYYIVAVEPEGPHVVTVFRLSDRAQEAGEKLWRTWFERFLVCRSSGVWPPYSERVEEIDTAEEIDLNFGIEETV